MEKVLLDELQKQIKDCINKIESFRKENDLEMSEKYMRVLNDLHIQKDNLRFRLLTDKLADQQLTALEKEQTKAELLMIFERAKDKVS